MALIGFNAERRFNDFETQQNNNLYVETRYTKDLLEHYFLQKKADMRRFVSLYQQQLSQLRANPEDSLAVENALKAVFYEFYGFALVDSGKNLLAGNLKHLHSAQLASIDGFTSGQFTFALYQVSPDEPLHFNLIQPLNDDSSVFLLVSLTDDEIQDLLTHHISTHRAFLLDSGLDGKVLLSSSVLSHLSEAFLNDILKEQVVIHFTIQGSRLVLVSLLSPDVLDNERRNIVIESLIISILLVIMFVILYHRIRRERDKVNQTENLMEEIFQNIPGMVFKRHLNDNQEQVFTFVSSGSKRIFALSSDVIYRSAHKIHHMIHPDDIDRVKHELRASAVNLSALKMDYRIIDANQDEHWVRDNSQPVHDENWDVVWHGVLLDITELKNIEDELRHSQKMESVGQLAAGIAHEINTPTQFVSDNIVFLDDAYRDLSEVIDFCSDLAQGKIVIEDMTVLQQQLNEKLEDADVEFLREEIPQAISQTREGLERVTRIVRAMKEFSHPSSALKTSIDINHVIDNAVTIARNEWKYVSTLELDLSNDMPLVLADAQLLGQVVLNMIVNAAHAIEALPGRDPETKGLITIKTSHDADRVMIKITDTGAGMSEKIRNRIFEPFFTTKEVGKGSGQGLAIAYSAVVDQHGGTIDVQSEPGKGTTFTIVLPLDQD